MVCPDAANKCGRSCAKRENLSAFRVVLVFLVLVQVVAAVAIVFFLAFSAATSSGERIFTQLMDSVIERSRSDMDDFFKHPLRLVRLMHAGMRWMLPGVIQQVRTSVWDPAATPTVFSALSFLINQAPGDIASLGFGTKNGSAFIVHVGNASVDFVTSMVSDVDSLTYVRLPEGAYARQTWDNVTEDVFRNDTLSDLLSQDRARVVNVVPQFNTTQRTWFVRVRMM